MANRVYGYQGYNKGYQFETSPKKLQPEYEPNEQNNPTKKVKTKTILFFFDSKIITILFYF